MVVKRKKLFDELYFEGFSEKKVYDFEKIILENGKYVQRGFAEENEDYKQPIGYVVMIETSRKDVFAYKRASKSENYKEKRLRGKWSWGIGGHIDKIDHKGENPIRTSVLREVEEEVDLREAEVEGLDLVGYINDDRNSIGKVHFGILYVLQFKGLVSKKDPEIEIGELENTNNLKKILKKENTEEWSKIIFPYLEDFIKKL